MITIDDEWFPSYDDMEQDKLVEGFHALLVNHITRYPINILKIGRLLDQRANVEVWGNRIECSSGPLSRHLEVLAACRCLTR